MATVSDRIYSELPNQPPEITEAFNLDKVVPSQFSDDYLEKHVNRQYVDQGSHEMGYKTFILDSRSRTKSLPRFTKTQPKLGSKDRRRLQIHSLPSENLRYADFVQLHILWLDYMKEALKYDRPNFDVNNRSMHETLLRVDFHGCRMRVVQSKCPTYVGLKGILIQDTKETFKIINKLNQVKTITKKNTVFAFRLGRYEVKIFGNNFTYRPADRINKKFKGIYSIHL